MMNRRSDHLRRKKNCWEASQRKVRPRPTYHVSAFEPLGNKLLHISHRPVGSSYFLSRRRSTRVGAFATVSKGRLREEGQGPNTRDEVETRGWNGAALAAFGEIVVDFFGADVPFPDRRDGVKLGESTLNSFLLLYMMADELFVAKIKAGERNKVKRTYLPGLPR